MTTAAKTQFMAKDETSYAEASVVPDRAWPVVVGSPMTIERDMIEGDAVRAGYKLKGTEDSVSVAKRCTGSYTFEPSSRGFAWWLNHILGSVTQSADDPETDAYTYTAVLGDLCGKSFTFQDNIPFGACQQTDRPYTYRGTKVAKAVLEMEAGGLMKLTVDLVAKAYITSLALQSPTYLTPTERFTFASSSATIASVSTPVTKWKLEIDNMLDTERIYAAGDPTIDEPVQDDDHRSVTIEAECDWLNSTFFDLSQSDTPSGLYGAISIANTCPTDITGTSTAPALNITAPNCRFTEVTPERSGIGRIKQKIMADVRQAPGVTDPLTVTYISGDTVA